MLVSRRGEGLNLVSVGQKLRILIACDTIPHAAWPLSLGMLGQWGKRAQGRG